MAIGSFPMEAPRRVSLGLVIGVVLVPWLFVWLLLRKGYAPWLRAAGFGWLVVLLMMASALTSHTPAKPEDVPLTFRPASDELSPEARAFAADTDAWAHPAHRLQLVVVRQRLEGFGNVYVADLAITNNNKFAVKDIAIACTVYGRSGTQLGIVEHTIFDVIAMGQKRIFRAINFGLVDPQTYSVGCEFDQAQSVD